MRNDKRKLLIITIGIAFLVVATSLFAYLGGAKNGMNRENIGYIAVSLVIIIFMTIFLARRYQSVKQGMPLEDERSKKIMLLATSRSYFVTMYWLLAISMFEKPLAGFVGLETLDAGQVVGGGILGMAVSFFGFWLYYNYKPNLIKNL